MGGEGLKPGDIFAGYEVVRRIGGGGMGAVYLVRHPKLQKLFALKVINDAFSDDPQFVTRFEREMVIVSTLRHPNIVSTSDAGTFDNRTWFTMTYVDGKDAAKTLDENPDGLWVNRVITITGALADALDYAHRQQVLHRDVKPNNVLIDQDGHVYLTDFGIAKAVGEGHSSLTYQQPYSVDYASPEQISNAVVDARSDVYSLAATCYTLLTARVPYPGDSPAAKINGHLNLPPPRPTATRPDLPPAVDEVIANAMSKDPTVRYPACTAFAEALRTALAGTPTVIEHNSQQPPVPVPPPSVSRPAGRRWIAAAVVALVLLAGLAGWILTRKSTTPVDPTGSSSPSSAPQPSPVSSPSSRSEPLAAGDPTMAGSDSAPATNTAAGTGSGLDTAASVVPLVQVLQSTLPTASGRSADQPVAGAATLTLGPRTCPNGVQQLALDTDSGVRRITATFLMSDDADPDTRTQVTVITDGVAGPTRTIVPRSGVTIDASVGDTASIVIELSTAGSGSCGDDDYDVFLTNAQAFR